MRELQQDPGVLAVPGPNLLRRWSSLEAGYLRTMIAEDRSLWLHLRQHAERSPLIMLPLVDEAQYLQWAAERQLAPDANDTRCLWALQEWTRHRCHQRFKGYAWEGVGSALMLGLMIGTGQDLYAPFRIPAEIYRVIVEAVKRSCCRLRIQVDLGAERVLLDTRLRYDEGIGCPIGERCDIDAIAALRLLQYMWDRNGRCELLGTNNILALWGEQISLSPGRQADWSDGDTRLWISPL